MEEAIETALGPTHAALRSDGTLSDGTLSDGTLSDGTLNVPEDTSYLRELVEAVTVVALIGVDLSGLITVFNSGAELMLGYRASEVIGKVNAEVFHLPEQVIARKAQLRAQLLRPVEFAELVIRTDEQGLSEATEWTMVRKDGSHFAGSLTVNKVLDSRCTVIGYVGVIQDITEQIAQKHRLEQALRAAESANRAKSEFLAAMSHEIRTPMNGILGMADLLLGSDLTSRQKGRMETLRDSGEALLTVLNDILDFSKLEASKMELEVADFDLRKLVEDVSDLVAVKAQEKDLEILYFIEPGVPTRLQGDPNRLRQVLLNLMGNAVKFTSSGSVALTVSRQAGSEDMLHFSVADTGPGIPPEKQHLLFQPFSQVDASTARRHGGTGLGLSIVAGLVKMLGGGVGFESTHKHGTTFWFTASLPAQPEIKRRGILSLAGKRVLIVDDSVQSRQHIRRYLRHWLCAADEESNIADALARLRTGNAHYDAVLVDSSLGKQSDACPNGEQLASALHSDPSLASLPLIAMTPLVDAHDTAYWQEKQFVRRVTKPLRQGDLGAALAGAMGYSALEKTTPAPPQRRDQRVKRAAMRLLLVEDNAVNREVALGILENLGYPADVACDGRQALDRLRESRYAAVITDCNLPELDGYELARRIRAGAPNVSGRHVPVIAMTAHALAGDREKCLEAGMDDYIPKPVRADVLEALLDHYTGVSGAPSEYSPTRGEADEDVLQESEATASPPMAETFDRADLIERLMGNEEMARRVADRFLTDIPNQLAALAGVIGTGCGSVTTTDREAARDLAHAIKGAAANISGVALSRSARNLETALGEGDADHMRHCFRQLTSEFEHAKLAIGEFVRESA